MIGKLFGFGENKPQPAEEEISEFKKGEVIKAGENLQALLEKAARGKGLYDINLQTNEVDPEAKPPEVTTEHGNGQYFLTVKLPDDQAPEGAWPLVTIELDAKHKGEEVTVTFGRNQSMKFPLEKIDSFVRLAETTISQANKYVYRREWSGQTDTENEAAPNTTTWHKAEKMKLMEFQELSKFLMASDLHRAGHMALHQLDMNDPIEVYIFPPNEAESEFQIRFNRAAETFEITTIKGDIKTLEPILKEYGLSD